MKIDRYKRIGGIILVSALTIIIAMSTSSVGVMAKGEFEGTKLKIAACCGPLHLALAKLAPQWEKLTGAEVEVDSYDYGPLHDKMLLDSVTRTASYDAFTLFYSYFPAFITSGALLPLNRFISDPNIVDPDLDIDDFDPSFIKAGTRGGNLLFLPYMPNARVWFYRKDLFDKFGIRIPVSTLEELKDIIAKLTIDENGDGKIDIYGYSPQLGADIHSVGSFLPYFWANGAELFDEDWKPTVNSSQAVEAMKFWVSLKPYCPPGCVNYTTEQVNMHLLPGGLAMADQWCDHSSRVDDPEESKVVGKIEFAPMGDIGGLKTFPCFWSLAIEAGSKNPLATYKFIEWVISKTTVPEFMKVGGIPTRRSALTNPSLIAKNRWFPAISENYKRSKQLPLIPEHPRIIRILGLAGSEIWAGILSPQASMKKAAKEIYKVMEDAGYYRKK